MKIDRLVCCLFALLFVATVSHAADRPNFITQDPKNTSMELTYFSPQMIQFPFEIKYPAAWYVREEVAQGMPCLFFTREPIKKVGDRYNVGVSLLYNIGYFASQEPSNSAIGQTAEMVIKMRDWEESKKMFVESLKEGGNSVISQADITISDQPSLKIEYKSKNARITTIYIKVGIHLLVMTLEAPPPEYEKYKGIFDKIVNSLFFTR